MCTCSAIVDTRQPGATRERTIANACDAVRNRHARQPGATPERTIANACDAAWNRHARQIRAIIKCAVQDISTRDGDRFQA